MPEFVRGVETLQTVRLSNGNNWVQLESIKEHKNVVVIELENIMEEDKIYEFVKKLRANEV